MSVPGNQVRPSGPTAEGMAGTGRSQKKNASTAQRWSLDSIPWGDLRRERVADNEELFYLVATASFIETTTDLYTSNLIEHFSSNEVVRDWLQHGWEPEELTHGRALREYTLRAWPDFDWDTQYAQFFADYSQVCKPETLLAKRGLEAVSRCVVEMGTVCFYTALHHACNEPVLAQITRHIYEDEVRHYKHFYRYFRDYRETENLGRTRVLGALWHRLRMIEVEDTYLSVKHVHSALHPGEPYTKAVYKDVITRCRKFAGHHFPHEMAANMLLKPLDMGGVGRWVLRPMVQGAAKLLTS